MDIYSIREAGQTDIVPLTHEQVTHIIGSHILSGGVMNQFSDHIWHLSMNDEIVSVMFVDKSKDSI